MKSFNEIFAENLNALMRECGISQNELARQIGVSVSAVNGWCNAVYMPRPNMIDILCDFFDVTQVELTMDKSEYPNYTIPAAHPIPEIDTIRTKGGKLSAQKFEKYFFVDNSIKADYCLRVEGDSMIDANIFHGDLAFIRKAYSFLDGIIYAVVFGNNEYPVLKKVYKQGKKTMLISCCNEIDPISASDAIIVGECVGIYHTI